MGREGGRGDSEEISAASKSSAVPAATVMLLAAVSSAILDNALRETMDE